LISLELDVFVEPTIFPYISEMRIYIDYEVLGGEEEVEEPSCLMQ